MVADDLVDALAQPLSRAAAGERTVNPSVRHTSQDYLARPGVARPIGREGAPMRAADSLP
ncbi:MAG TPA: hypothetical protein VGD09_09640 [Blastococcus sp.]